MRSAYIAIHRHGQQAQSTAMQRHPSGRTLHVQVLTGVQLFSARNLNHTGSGLKAIEKIAHENSTAGSQAGKHGVSAETVVIVACARCLRTWMRGLALARLSRPAVL